MAPKPSLDSTVKRTVSTPAAGASPSPVAQAFQAYQQGIKAKYRADYPPSAKANGQLANVVARVGAEHVVALVQSYLAHPLAFYGKVKHSLDFLVRDCEKIFLEMQAAASPAVAGKAIAALLRADESVIKEAGAFDIEEPQAVALKALRANWRLATDSAKYIGVRIGAERRIYSVEELKGIVTS